GLGDMHRKYGKSSWGDLFAEAITFARDGFGATRAYGHFADEYRATLIADPRSAAMFLADGQPPSLGAAIVQPELARTLEEIAADGAETFYRGRLARRLAAALEDAGTLVAAADLEAFEAELQEPIGIDYRGCPGRSTCAARPRPAPWPLPPATRRISAPPMARAMPCRGCRASTAASAPVSWRATPGSCSITG